MGSTGSGNFSDYSQSSSGTSGAGTSGGGTSTGGGLAAGGQGAGVSCGADIDVDLQEVGTSQYFAAHNVTPPPDTAVRVRPSLVGGRIGVEASDTSEVVGVLPTDHNYLLRCLNEGYTYAGRVSLSLDAPFPRVRVELQSQ